MSDYCISLFGRFLVKKDDLILAGFEGAKVQELFCYLLLYHDRPHHREHLATVLWPEQAAAPSKKYLRKTLWQLQSNLISPDEQQERPFLAADNEWIQLNIPAECQVDAVLFEQAFAKVGDIPGVQLNSAQAEIVEQMAALYQGDLLEGWYQEWCLFERERFLHMYLKLCDKLMRYCTANAAYEAGIAYGANILRYDRARERTHRQLMRLHYLSGNRTGALRQYQRCRQALQEELGVAPARLTQDLYQQICADALPPDVARPFSPLKSSPPADAESWAQVLQNLKQMQGNLAHLQQNLSQEIIQLESRLNPPPA